MSDSKCPMHKCSYKEEPHPHDNARTHRYCPECREAALRTVDRVTPDDKLRERAQRQLRRSGHVKPSYTTIYGPDGLPTG